MPQTTTSTSPLTIWNGYLTSELTTESGGIDYNGGMSSRHINPNQLRMFMTPREIAATVQQAETNIRKPEDLKNDYVAKSKLIRAKNNGLADSIVKEGVKKPIDIMHEYDDDWGDETTQLVNGHHRFSVSLDVAPDKYIPVQHHSKFETIDWTTGDSDPRGLQNYGNPARMWGNNGS